MIEIRTFEGDAEELSAFIQRIWRGDYAGRLPITIWSPEFFDWQLLNDVHGARAYAVAAYDGGRLVGTLSCQAHQYHVHDRIVDGSMCSWQAVDPDYRRQGLSRNMLEELHRRHQEREAWLSLGFPLARSFGTRFWGEAIKVVPVQKLGFWVRLLDHRAVARWEPSRWLGLGARAAGLMQRRLPSPAQDSTVRPYESRDMPACLELLEETRRNTELGFVWSEKRLAHQLSYKDMVRTMVAEDNGRVAGFINYYYANICGNSDLRAALVDLIVWDGLSSPKRKGLLSTTLHQMHEEGAAFASVLSLRRYPWRQMAGAGFWPIPGVVRLDATVMTPSLSLDGVTKVFVYCR